MFWMNNYCSLEFVFDVSFHFPNFGRRHDLKDQSSAKTFSFHYDNKNHLWGLYKMHWLFVIRCFCPVIKMPAVGLNIHHPPSLWQWTRLWRTTSSSRYFQCQRTSTTFSAFASLRENPFSTMACRGSEEGARTIKNEKKIKIKKTVGNSFCQIIICYLWH